MLDLLGGILASEIIARTSDTPRVLRAVELSLAPAFLLVGIGSIMNVMMTRIIWIAGRIERLADNEKGTCDIAHASEIEWLRKRRRFVRVAITFSMAAAVTISVVIAILFVSAYIQPRIGTLVAVLWVVTVALLISGLVFFLRETLLAADGPTHDRRP
ncbi:DUF2721 domain-containing protein [Erythrobacter sp.]|jgi:hypothetical protein|uniref:DUF2721 domain-containing protein n=1 Tax=Erythrobacter sp. TaxID=1042 RepID=UPI002EB009BF|nr:DUF2721 domain-containing protein [Erythrobacter sp.]